jgi:carboxylesterase
MGQPEHLNPEAFFLPGGPVGALLIHGLTGSPPEMRLIGDYLHARGLTVRAPLLPGHGATPAELQRCGREDWMQAAAQALDELQAQCETVFVGGLSLGALLGIYLAAHRPEVQGLILYSPPLRLGDWRASLAPLAKHVLRSAPKGPAFTTDPAAQQRYWCYDVYPTTAVAETVHLTRQARRWLPQVRCPLLIFHSTLDRDIHPRSAQLTYEEAGSSAKQIVTLHNSGHALTVDSEWEDVAARTYAFINNQAIYVCSNRFSGLHERAPLATAATPQPK